MLAAHLGASLGCPGAKHTGTAASDTWHTLLPRPHAGSAGITSAAVKASLQHARREDDPSLATAVHHIGGIPAQLQKNVL